jgi:twitching motility two-component system response regulator PilH
MPGMNGFAVLRALRLSPLTRHIPIVMISGNPQATEQFYVQRFGADDFMKKPFDREEVRLRIGQLVALGRLAARLPAVPTDVPEPLLSIADMSAEDLSDIPDVAMPDADVGPHLSGPAVMPKALLQAVHRVG